MIEPFCAHRRRIAQSALYLVGHGERGQVCAPATARILGDGQRRPQVVARMAGLSFGQVTVVEIQVAYERAVVERSLIWRRSTAADQGGMRIAAEIFDLRPKRIDRLSF